MNNLLMNTVTKHNKVWPRPSGMLDTSAPGQIGTAPGQIGTRTLRHLCEKFRYQDKSATGQFDIPIRQIGTSKRQIGTCGFFKVVLAVASFWSLFNPNYLNLLSYKFFPADFRWSVIDGRSYSISISRMLLN
jgi:hypothetical protein